MQTRIDVWAKKGGKKDKLWESVKNAEKREGVVVLADDVAKMEVDGDDDECKKPAVNGKPKKGKVEREVERLNLLLDQVVKLREEVKKGMEVVVWREKLLELATERAEQVGQCGWDQRLCFGDEEWSDFGAGVLESYEEVKGEGDMQVDGAAEEDGEWWCPGKSLCDRHNGYVPWNMNTSRHFTNAVELLVGKPCVTEMSVKRRRKRKTLYSTSRPENARFVNA